LRWLKPSAAQSGIGKRGRKNFPGSGPGHAFFEKKKQNGGMSFSFSRFTTSALNLQKFFAELFFKKATAYFFLLCALPTGLGLALFTPIGEVPDEPTHIARADGLLYGDILGYPTFYQPPAGGQVEILSGVTNSLSVVKASVSELWPTFPANARHGRESGHPRFFFWRFQLP